MMGELVSRTEGANAPMAGRATDTATVTIAYNGAGQPTTHTAAGAVTKHGYDSAGFRKRLASPDFGTVTFKYNRFGELRERTDGKGTTTWKYDVLGRPKTRRDPDGVAQGNPSPHGSPRSGTPGPASSTTTPEGAPATADGATLRPRRSSASPTSRPPTR